MGARLSGLRILVVDGLPEMRDLLDEWLSGEGAEVATAASAHEALALARNGFPDLAVLNLAIPSEEGFLLVSRMRALERKRGVEIPILAISTRPRSEVEMPALGAGFDAFVQRPTEAEPLVRLIRSLASDEGQGDGE